jgi:hypothetical protein
MFPRKHTISGLKLMAKWDMDVHELSYLILKHGIIVLKSSDIPKIKFSFNPEYYKIDFTKLLDTIQKDPNSLSEKLFWLPELEKPSIKKEVSSLKSKSNKEPSPPAPHELGRYRGKDQELRFCRDGQSPKVSKSEPTPPAESHSIKDIIEEHESGIKQHSNVFSLMGKVWFVKFKQQEWGLYPDQEKYKYIANILNLPNNSYNTGDLEFSIYNTELVEKVKGVELTEEYRGDKAQEDIGDLNESNLSEVLTSQEVKKFKEIGYELLEQLKKAKDAGDQEQIDDAKKNLVKYRSYISSEYGIKTKISDDETKIHFKILHRSGKENEKIRQRIKNQIKNAIKDFHDSLPMLRMHLDRSIKTKSYKTVYLPETHTNWHISM